MRLLPWNVTVKPGGIDSIGAYDYGPDAIRVADGSRRIVACTGLGTDTITFVRADGSGKAAPIHFPDSLVADPCIVKVGSGFRIVFTYGQPDGKNNSVCWVPVGLDGRLVGQRRTLVAPSGNPATYGNGQPHITPWKDGWLIVWRADGPAPGVLKAGFLDAKWRTVVPLIFSEPEDGASPAVAVLPSGKIGILMQGGGWVGWRTYQLDGGRLRRDRGNEFLFSAASGSFSAVTARHIPDAVDGPGYLKNTRNRIIVDMVGNAEVWVGVGNPADPGSWWLHTTKVPVPHG